MGSGLGSPDARTMMKPGMQSAAARVLLFLPLLLLSGCDWVVLTPTGSIGQQEKILLITTVCVMLLVVIPVIFLTLFFAWKYRASNTKATYLPDFAHSTKIEVVIWVIPCLIIIALGIITWTSTQALDPYRPLVSSVKPVEIEVVALDWKWLFIYPDEKIATINQIALPVGTPVNFTITSDSVMNSFFIPSLGSQIYAMAGMKTRLHLIAGKAGTYPGLSANFSGAGFSDMRFTAIATDGAGFADWVKKVRASGTALHMAELMKIEAPSEKVAPTYFSTVDNGLFDGIIDKYMGKAMNMQAALKPGMKD
jgi:cytochrome o ubiquinol oxidase subunit II